MCCLARYYEVRCGWVTVAVGSQLGSQLGFPSHQLTPLLGLGVAAVLLLGLELVNGESVKTAWYRQAVNSTPCPAAASG